MKNSVQTVIVPNYLNQFTCIGAECEDNCCQHNWKIWVDKPHFKKIKQTMQASGDEALFKQRLKINRKVNSSNDYYAEIILSDKGCSFLNPEGLCGLQCQYGAALLPNVCQTYPRNQLYNGKRVEIYATLSCPEIARLCLLQPDALHLVEADKTLSAMFKQIRSAHDTDNGYRRYLNEVRTTMFELLNPARYSLQQRLFLMLFFAIRTEPDFYQGIEHDPGMALKQHVDYIQAPATQAEILELIEGIACSTDKPLHIILRMLLNVKKTDLVRDVVFNASGLDVNDAEDCQKTLALEQIYQTFKQRADTFESIWADRLNQYFTHYCMNYWLSDWFTESENLVIHLRKLLVRVVCLRFMLFNCSEVLAIDTTADRDVQIELLDRAAVKVFYQFSRMYEHNEVIIKKIENDIESHGYGQPVLASLIKF